MKIFKLFKLWLKNCFFGFLYLAPFVGIIWGIGYACCSGSDTHKAVLGLATAFILFVAWLGLIATAFERFDV